MCKHITSVCSGMSTVLKNISGTTLQALAPSIGQGLESHGVRPVLLVLFIYLYNMN